MTTDIFRYAAFVSYSSKDSDFARRLHRALENYGIPSSLGALSPSGSRKRNRIYPVFRDREELSAGQLGGQIEANLRASGALIVVCSPNGAASPWVQKEIEFFAQLGRRDKIFAIISDNAPQADENGNDCTLACFPPAFRGDALEGDKLEPLAADARRGKDGFRNAWLKIVAGLVGVSPGQLIDRDRARQRSRFATNAALTALFIVAFSALAINESRWRPQVDAFLEGRQHYDVAFNGPLRGVHARLYQTGRPGAEVMFNGIVVGAVTDIDLDSADPRIVVVRIAVSRDVPVRATTRVELQHVGEPGRPVIVLYSEPNGALLNGNSRRRNVVRLQGSVEATGD